MLEHLGSNRPEGIEDPDSRHNFSPPEELGRKVWGLEFQSPLMNAAGVFKSAKHYRATAQNGAGAYLAGTFTPEPREGRTVDRDSPFLHMRESGATVNALGLPNPGFAEGQANIKGVDRLQGCPYGTSITGSPDNIGERKYAEEIVEGLLTMEDAGVDFVEINESCPNTEKGRPQTTDLEERLEHISREFLDSHDLPVIVKFSNDTPPEEVEHIVDLLAEHGFHGINFGNTSENYERYSMNISGSEERSYRKFTGKHGGGIGGRPLKKRSLDLAGRAVKRAQEKHMERDFLVVRTGGVEGASDIRESDSRDIGMNQWFTGYLEALEEHGNRAYQETFKDL